MVLSDDSVLVMGGTDGGYKNDVWKTVDGGASWIMVTSSAGWRGKGIQLTGFLSSRWVDLVFHFHSHQHAPG